MDYRIELEAKKDGTKKYYDVFTSRLKPTVRTISPAHTHSYYEINNIKVGQLFYAIGDEELCLNENDIIIVFPNVIHKTFTNARPEDPSIINTILKFSSSFIQPANYSSSDLQYLLTPLKFDKQYAIIRASEPLNEKLTQLINMAAEETKSLDNGYEIALRGYMSLIYTVILRNLSASETHTEVKSAATKENIDLIYKALDYIENNYYEQISMQQLAKEYNVNYYHFSRLFQQYTGQCFRDYLLKVRLDKAVRLLLQTNDSVTNIAMDCGFETISYFIKKFQEHTGSTPKNFRKQYFEKEVAPVMEKSAKSTYLDKDTLEVVE